MNSRFLALAVIIILTATATSHSQIQKAHFSVKRNYGIPVGKSTESHWGDSKMGYGAGLNLNFFMNDRFAVGFDASYLEFSGKRNPENLRVSKEIFTFTGTLNYYFFQTWMKPYLSAGTGLSNETFVFRIVDDNNFFDQLDHINVPLFLIGAGCNFRFSENAYFVIESKLTTIFSKNAHIRIDKDIQKINFNTNYISLFGGLNYEIKY